MRRGLGTYFRCPFFRLFLDTVLDAKRVPQRTPKSTPRAPKTLPRGVRAHFPKRLLKKVDFLLDLGAPGTLKMEPPPRRELNFHFFPCLDFGPKMEPKMDPKSSPNGPQTPWKAFRQGSRSLLKNRQKNEPKIVDFGGPLGTPWGAFGGVFWRELADSLSTSS